MQEPLTLGLHEPVAQVAQKKGDRLHCLIAHQGENITSCYIPEMHVTPGTKFVVEQQAWRVEQVECGVEEFDRVLICAREYS